MKMYVFLCLHTGSDSKGRNTYVRARLTFDEPRGDFSNSHSQLVDMYTYPTSEHHSCCHGVTQVRSDESRKSEKYWAKAHLSPITNYTCISLEKGWYEVALAKARPVQTEFTL